MLKTILLLGLSAFTSLFLILVGKEWYCSSKKNGLKNPHLLVYFGSGGHTGEMMNLLGAIEDQQYPIRSYVVGADDKMSYAKAEALISSNSHQASSVFTIPRARHVKQSWLTTPFTAAWSLIFSAKVIFWNKNGIPDVILCNGPGTCVILCLEGYVSKFFGKRIRIVYVESFARVNRLSLSGKILLPFVDRFLVQWPDLSLKYKGVEYVGVVA
ncbi:UDP-GlcNAc transferase associated protein Alg14 [Schizosaccharomyces octosporus yFS286]|uniref:UDP-N-acetylglucosamine transferase subunit ALG14 n=1 Tax=Schizosaccharomyces octosporus (strain yFS286) TaxID=483514 RepID=S9RLL7_SCHOY|nr:UDP-GlcNAc transferase associated protein Alg14 [Schizosaccharomyces octosporus yFS286]EPX74869.1 UDP-GlcNAc transferase associated protein Alg14 [Schizosaccharomyces octosporus yFS286]